MSLCLSGETEALGDSSALPCPLQGGVWERFQGAGEVETSVHGVSPVPLQWFGGYRVRDRVMMSRAESPVAKHEVCPLLSLQPPCTEGHSQIHLRGSFQLVAPSFLRTVRRLLWQGRAEVREVTLKPVLSVFSWSGCIFPSAFYTFVVQVLVSQIQRFSLVQITSWGTF